MSVGTAGNAVCDALANRVAGGADLVVLREGQGRSDAFAARFPDRVIDLPMSDRAMVGLGLGLGAAGRQVVCELSDASRLAPVLDALIEAGAVARASEHGLSLVVRAPWGAGGHVVSLDTVAGAVPVAFAAGPDQAAALLAAAWVAGPWVLLEGPRAEGPISAAPRLLREGGHVLIVAFGAEIGIALDAAARLAGEGIEVAVLDPVWISPLPAEVGARLRRCGRIVVVTPSGETDLGRRICRAGLDEAFLYLEAPLRVVCRSEGVEGIAAACRASALY
jgi:pyruvate/2-oxoglutarate/acetoin dehydrogenase E1 component